MAGKRMLHSKIVMSKQVAELSGHDARLTFTWLLAFTDRDGRAYGDPALVRSMLFPRSTDPDVERMTAILAELHLAGLIYWYTADDGDLYIAFPGFANHQRLRYDREAESVIPDPDECQPMTEYAAEILRSQSGVSPELGGVNLIEFKLNKYNRIKEEKPPTRKKPESVEFPPSLDNPEFRAAWDEWIEYRKSANLRAWKPVTVKRKLAELAEHPDPVAVLHLSIGNGWQGLFPEKITAADRRFPGATDRQAENLAALARVMAEDQS